MARILRKIAAGQHAKSKRVIEDRVDITSKDIQKDNRKLSGFSTDIKNVGVKLLLPKQLRHGGYLDGGGDADVQHLISATGAGFQIGDSINYRHGLHMADSKTLPGRGRIAPPKEDIGSMIDIRTSNGRAKSQKMDFEAGDVTADQFPGAIELIVPAGIGDISWIYAKIKYLKEIINKEILIWASSDEPKRSADFVRLLPEVHWAGYVNMPSWNCLIQSLPSEWPERLGFSPFVGTSGKICLAANNHVELGRPLAQWLPCLPIDYHYKLSIPDDIGRKTDIIMSKWRRPIIAAYVSNRDKELYRAGGWNLWDVSEWVDFLHSVGKIPECKNATFVLIGADWDVDKTSTVAWALSKKRHQVLTVLGQPLAFALSVLQRSDYFFSYPSGLGILGNVLRVPTLMLLPWILKPLEQTYADPQDMAAHLYRAWSDPKPMDVLYWFQRIVVPQLEASQPLWQSRALAR